MPFSNKREQEELFEISKNNNEVAFRSFFDRHHGRLYQLAKLLTHSNEVAEEIVSDVFIKVWKNRIKLPKLKNIKAYLFIATKNQSLSFLRANREPKMVMSIDRSVLDVKISVPDAETCLINQELLVKLEESVRGLPEKCALVYQMVKEDDMSYKEVAKALNVSVKAVEKHMSTALKRIRIDIVKYLECTDINLEVFIAAIFMALV